MFTNQHVVTFWILEGGFLLVSSLKWTSNHSSNHYANRYTDSPCFNASIFSYWTKFFGCRSCVVSDNRIIVMVGIEECWKYTSWNTFRSCCEIFSREVEKIMKSISHNSFSPCREPKAGSSESEATAVLLTTRPQYLLKTSGTICKHTSKLSCGKLIVF